METDITRADRLPQRVRHEIQAQQAEERRIIYDALTETLGAWADDPRFFIENPGMHVVVKLLNLDSRPEFLEVFKLGERALGLDAMLKKIRSEIMQDLPSGAERDSINNNLDRRNYNSAVVSSFCDTVSHSPDALGIERAMRFLDEALTDPYMFTSQGARFFLAKLFAVLNEHRGAQDKKSPLFSIMDNLHTGYFRKFAAVAKEPEHSQEAYSPLWRRGAAYEFLSGPLSPEGIAFVKDVLAELKAALKIEPELPSKKLRIVADVPDESPPVAMPEEISHIAAEFAQAVIRKLEGELQRKEGDESILPDHVSLSESTATPIPLTRRLTPRHGSSDDELRAEYNQAMFEAKDIARSARAAEGSLFQPSDTDELTPKPVNGNGRRVASFGPIIATADAAVGDRTSVVRRVLNFFRG